MQRRHPDMPGIRRMFGMAWKKMHFEHLFIMRTYQACCYQASFHGWNPWQINHFSAAKLLLLYVCALLSENVNYSVNFILYCITMKRFRAEFLNFLCTYCRCRPHNVNATQKEMVTVTTRANGSCRIWQIINEKLHVCCNQ